MMSTLVGDITRYQEFNGYNIISQRGNTCMKTIAALGVFFTKRRKWFNIGGSLFMSLLAQENANSYTEMKSFWL